MGFGNSVPEIAAMYAAFTGFACEFLDGITRHETGFGWGGLRIGVRPSFFERNL